MKDKVQFDFDRLVFMLRHDWAKYWKKILMIIGGAFMSATLIALLFTLTGDHALVANEMHLVLFPLILFFGGMFLVSLSFRDLNNDTERIFYLGMPASHLEKYASRFIYTGILFPLFISIVYCIYAFLYDSVVLMALDSGITRFSFFSNIFEGSTPTSFDFLKFYLPLHSIFFLGAIAFRKLAFFKTLFTGFVFFFMMVSVGYITARIVLPELFAGGGFLQEPTIEPNEWFKEMFETYLDDILYIIGLIITPIVFWVAGYFKLTEKEA